ncbi:hypothetical protein KCP74_04700 [Salmonella enterica subsp. enterica]|nr:hypothetical protein KCP74_04700 [Salmonella enterica subsp. enterica]
MLRLILIGGTRITASSVPDACWSVSYRSGSLPSGRWATVNTNNLAFANFRAVTGNSLPRSCKPEQRKRHRFTLTVGDPVRRSDAGPLHPDGISS